MSSQRPLILSALLAICTWSAVRLAVPSCFAVTGVAPEGFSVAPSQPRAEVPQAPTPGLLGDVADTDKGGVAMGAGKINRHGESGKKSGYYAEKYYDRLLRRDNGFQVGEEAYRHPPPIPDDFAGTVHPASGIAHCDRVYKHKFIQCRRLGEVKRRRNDCEYDAFRWRRTCYWKVRPDKIHPNFRNKDTRKGSWNA
eukprot:TRINITY_DN91411_c0_g1_i1.p1 TRINITY_DN91411_c0_g1~~TRINITY_DN91411_c0_g1_i1.p1  ORF type:complete len:196 (-),score=29.11 TRINITY_DN91411_c0_g1_i1:169-756(-)